MKNNLLYLWENKSKMLRVFNQFFWHWNPHDAPPSSNCLMDSTTSLKVMAVEGEKVQACSLAYNTWRVEGRVGALRWGLGRLTTKSIIHKDLHKPNNKLVNAQLQHFWCTNEPRTNTNSQDSPQLELRGKSPPSPLFYVHGHGASTQMSFSLGFPNGSFQISKIGTPVTLEAHNFVCKPLIKMRSKAKLQPSLRTFQRYVAHHLHIGKLKQFLTFSDWESNWQFDSRPFFWP